MKKGIVSFDMDMTLLDHKDYKVPESALRALELLRENYYIVVATGRDMDSAYSAGLLDHIDPDAVIHQNGTKITVGDRLIYEHRMDPGLVEQLVRYAEGKPFAIGATVDGHDYYVNPQYVTIHDMLRWKSSIRSFADPDEIGKLPVRTMVYMGPVIWASRIEQTFPAVKLPLFAAKTGADVIEICASKAEGLRRLCEYFHIDIRDTIAFGDSMNDYEIVKAAGIGVAMGNGFPDLKAAADYVTAPIGDDGVWKACVALDLIGSK